MEPIVGARHGPFGGLVARAGCADFGGIDESGRYWVLRRHKSQVANRRRGVLDAFLRRNTKLRIDDGALVLSISDMDRYVYSTHYGKNALHRGEQELKMRSLPHCDLICMDVIVNAQL